MKKTASCLLLVFIGVVGMVPDDLRLVVVCNRPHVDQPGRAAQPDQEPQGFLGGFYYAWTLEDHHLDRHQPIADVRRAWRSQLNPHRDLVLLRGMLSATSCNTRRKGWWYDRIDCGISLTVEPFGEQDADWVVGTWSAHQDCFCKQVPCLCRDPLSKEQSSQVTIEGRFMKKLSYCAPTNCSYYIAHKQRIALTALLGGLAAMYGWSRLRSYD